MEPVVEPYPPFDSKFRTTSDEDVNVNHLGNLHLSPLKNLRSKDPGAYHGRIIEIQNSVFDCHPGFPEESINPEDKS